jgi:hypothetical protein
MGASARTHPAGRPVNAERLLSLLLRFVGGVCLLAVLAVFMPKSTMAGIHESIGLGEFPDPPIAAYLARATSALYAFYGGLLLLLARDVRRYRDGIRYQAIAIMLCSAAIVAMNPSAGRLLTYLIIDAVACWAYCMPTLFLLFRIPAESTGA